MMFLVEEFSGKEVRRLIAQLQSPRYLGNFDWYQYRLGFVHYNMQYISSEIRHPWHGIWPSDRYGNYTGHHMEPAVYDPDQPGRRRGLYF